jgi:mono/diheme cytochrome c family protein
MKKLILAIIVLTGLGLGAVYAGNGYHSDYYDNDQARIVIRDKVVEYDPDYFLGTYGYYKIGDELREKVEKQKVSDTEMKLLLLEKQIELLKLQMQKDCKPETPKTDVPTTPETPAAPKTDSSAMVELVKARCFNCHGGPQTKGNLVLLKNDKLADLSLAQVDLVEIHTFFDEHAKDAGLSRMPKGGKPLTDQELSVIRKWRQDKVLGE